MPDPLTVLIVGLFVLAGCAALFWPGSGLAGRWLRGRRAADRVRVEDALKHLWECEYRQRPASLESLAGTLGIDGRRVAELVERLARLGLVRHDGGGLELSSDGRRDALRVVRIHRLWERYLADETGLDARAWHAEAERLEHRTSAEQAEAMAASLGHPRFDPHGDPIPMPSGELPPAEGEPLTRLAVDEFAEIVHVEDEPEAIFAQLAAAGLAPGTRVRVLESTPRRIRLAAETEEVVLAPVVAANVTVRPLAEPPAPLDATVLSALGRGERAEVVGLAPALRGAQRRRLLDLGVVPGTVIENELESPSRDPTAYRIRGALIALRRDQSDLVQVRLLGGEGAAS
jgi:DtxR family Mn-dependent transcriptional regulator